MRRALRILSAILFYTLLLSGGAAAKSDFKGTVCDVIDGDTIKVAVWRFDPESRNWSQQINVVRLAGIDAPEIDQEHGLASREYLLSLVEDCRVEIKVSGKDWHGRLIGQVDLIDYPYHLNMPLDVCADMVLNGQAWWYRRFAARDTKLQLYEKTARENSAGLWKKTKPQAPWDYRAQKYKRPAQASSSHCWEV